MKEYTYTKSRQNLKSVISEATVNHEIIRIKNRNGQSVIMLDENDYNSLLETAYLLRSPKNSERLMEAKARAKEDAIDFEAVIQELDL
jgi:antitoxin YefM